MSNVYRRICSACGEVFETGASNGAFCSATDCQSARSKYKVSQMAAAYRRRRDALPTVVLATKRVCAGCHKNKDISEYYADPSVSTGIKSRCKGCMAPIFAEYQKGRARDRAISIRDARRTNPAGARRQDRERRKKDPQFKAWRKCRNAAEAKTEKGRARHLLKLAVRRGEIVKPKRCERCHVAHAKAALQGHHADYSKPLDVQWLCSLCHGEEHSKWKR